MLAVRGLVKKATNSLAPNPLITWVHANIPDRVSVTVPVIVTVAVAVADDQATISFESRFVTS